MSRHFVQLSIAKLKLLASDPIVKLFKTETHPSVQLVHSDQHAQFNLHVLCPNYFKCFSLMYLSNCPLNILQVLDSTTSSGILFHMPTPPCHILCGRNLLCNLVFRLSYSGKNTTNIFSIFAPHKHL